MRIQLTTAGAAAAIGSVGGLLMGLLGVAIGSAGGNQHAAVLLRGVLPLAMVLLGMRVVTGWALRSGLREPLPWMLGGALLGYLLDPFSWNARAGIAQLALGAGVTAYLMDLVMWLAVATLGGIWAAAETPVGDRPHTPYG